MNAVIFSQKDVDSFVYVIESISVFPAVFCCRLGKTVLDGGNFLGGKSPAVVADRQGKTVIFFINGYLDMDFFAFFGACMTDTVFYKRLKQKF